MNNADMPAMPHKIVFGKGYPEDYDNTGLTKREHFAGLAMQGLLAGGYCIEAPLMKLNEIPSEAITLADALLKELEK